MDTPFPRSYWVAPGALLAGYYPGALDPSERDIKLSALLEAGIRIVVNLMEPDETDWEGHPFEPYSAQMKELAAQHGWNIQCLRLPVRDGGTPTPTQMRRILDAIETGFASGKTVYLHCWGGKGRTGTVVGCFLARNGIAVGEAALARIMELRRGDARANEPSPETRAQCEMVRGWKLGW
jgi:protein-tyrosine phosphatase